MRRIYRIREWAVREDTGGLLRLTVKFSCHPSLANLRQIVISSFPGTTVTPSRQGTTGWLSLSNEEELTLSGGDRGIADLEELLRLQCEILTVCDSADVSHCLDLYQTPQEGPESTEWLHTEVGDLTYRAKYRWDGQAAQELAGRMSLTIARHPALRSASAVVAMPTSGSGRHYDAPNLWRGLMARRFGFEEIRLDRTRVVVEQKAIQSREERARNQEGSMECSADVRGKVVLVLDDLYMEGDTMNEAIRALRARGAERVLGLCAAKTATGTQGGVQSVLPDSGDEVSIDW